MEHFTLLIFLFSMLFGFMCIGFFAYLRIKYEHPLIQIHLYQLIFYSLYVFFASIYYYGLINTNFFKESAWYFISPFVLPILLTPLIYFMGKAYYFIAGIDWTPKAKTVFVTLAATIPLLAAFKIFAGNGLPLEYVMATVLLVHIWCYVLLVRNYKKIQEPLLKFIAKLIFLLPLYSIPIGIIDAMAMNRQILNDQIPMGIMGQPLVYFLNNMMSLIVLFKARSLMGEQSAKTPQAFALKYSITTREKEILQLLEKGFSNKEIASQLFISPSTVRNHLSAIFEKTSANTRTKLISLMQTFR